MVDIWKEVKKWANPVKVPTEIIGAANTAMNLYQAMQQGVPSAPGANMPNALQQAQNYQIQQQIAGLPPQQQLAILMAANGAWSNTQPSQTGTGTPRGQSTVNSAYSDTGQDQDIPDAAKRAGKYPDGYTGPRDAPADPAAELQAFSSPITQEYIDAYYSDPQEFFTLFMKDNDVDKDIEKIVRANLWDASEQWARNNPQNMGAPQYYRFIAGLVKGLKDKKGEK